MIILENIVKLLVLLALIVLLTMIIIVIIGGSIIGLKDYFKERKRK